MVVMGQGATEPTAYEASLGVTRRLLPYYRALRGQLGMPRAVINSGGWWRNADLADVIGHTFDSAKMRELKRRLGSAVLLQYRDMPNGGRGYVVYRLAPSHLPCVPEALRQKDMFRG